MSLAGYEEFTHLGTLGQDGDDSTYTYLLRTR